MKSPDAKTDAGMSPWRWSGVELDYPVYVIAPKARLGHTPFALWLMSALRPRTVVDLGLGKGACYCACLQAAGALGLETRCFGIDGSGEGNPSETSNASYDGLRAYHDSHYAAFSTLIRSSFDDAHPLFSDGGVDLLQFEDFETSESLALAFASWLPKMSSRGVVLLHDTNLRKPGFDVWRCWEDIARRYPSFEFTHSQGLGVAYVGSDPMPPALEALLKRDAAEDISGARRYFARLGVSVIERLESGAPDDAAADMARDAGDDLAEDPLMGTIDGEQARAAEGSHPLLQNDMRIRTLRRQMILNARLQREIAEANREKDHYARQVQQIYASHSWRLTAPLRFVITKLRGR